MSICQLNDLVLRKQKFLEVLLTLGSLLAVFLGLVAERTPTFMNGVLVFGILFTASALSAYTVVLFPERIGGRWRGLAILLPRFGVALSFAGLITLGVAYAFSEGFGVSPNIWTEIFALTVVVPVFLLSLSGTYLLIWWVMNLVAARSDEP